MNEFQKASILLQHLTPAEREQILGRLDVEQREQLERIIAERTEVSQIKLADIVSEYQSWLQRLPLERDRELEPADSDQNPASEADRGSPALQCDSTLLKARLVEEPATVLCAVMCQLHETTARELFESLSEDRRSAVVAQLPSQGELKPLVKQELARCLSALVAGGERDSRPGEALLNRLVGS